MKVRVETLCADHLTETRQTATAIAHLRETSFALAIYSQQVAVYRTGSSDSEAGTSLSAAAQTVVS